MKRLFNVLTALLISAGMMTAQTFVAPGDGTLSAAISAAATGDVLELASGGVYTESLEAELATLVDMELTIRTEAFGTDRAIVTFNTATSEESNVTFFEIGNNASLTVQGIEFDGSLNGEANAVYFANVYAGPSDALADAYISKIHIEDCFVHDLSSFVIAAGNSALAGFAPDITAVVDSTIINNSIFERTGTVVYYKYAGCNYVSLTRSTMNTVGPYGLRIAGPGETQLWSPDYTPWVFIDQTTWYKTGSTADMRETIQGEKGPLNDPWVVSNSIFVNQLSKDRTTINIKDTPEDAGATIRSIAWWDVGAINFRLHTVIDTVEMDPQFADPENGDFTLPTDSPLQTFASHGGPIGDPRWAATAVGIEGLKSHPESIRLAQNYPNPFNPATEIAFSLSRAGDVRMNIYDLQGRLLQTILNAPMDAGDHRISVDMSRHAAGLYVYSLQQGLHHESRKMILLK